MLFIDGERLDPFNRPRQVDIDQLRAAHEEHQAWHEAEVLQEGEVHTHEYYRTAHDVDVLVEKLGLDYGDARENLAELWQGREQGITP